MIASKSTASSSGLTSLVANSKFRHPSFFRKVKHMEPLNVDSVVEKVHEVCGSFLGVRPQDIILQRSSPNTARLLLFHREGWESLKRENEQKRNQTSNNNSIGHTSSKTAAGQRHHQHPQYRSSHRIQNMTARSLIENNPGMFLTSSAPIAQFCPPPLLPFPVPELSVWDGVVKTILKEDDKEDKTMTLDEYLQMIQSVKARHLLSGEENEGAESSSKKRIIAKKDLVGLLTVTTNYLSFVIADSEKNVINGPITSTLTDINYFPSSAMGNGDFLGGGISDYINNNSSNKSSFFPDERHKTSYVDRSANTQKFQSEFWKKVADNLLSQSSSPESKEIFDRVACIWFRSQNDSAMSFYQNCTAPLLTDAEKNVVDNNDNRQKELSEKCIRQRQLLRDDPRWLRLPGFIAAGKKASYDVDSLLRDCHIGNINLVE